MTLPGFTPSHGNVSFDEVDPYLAEAAGRLRTAWGADLPVNSAYRSPEYNARVGGAKGSQHMHGTALDLNMRGMSESDRARLLDAAFDAGFTSFGFYADHPDMLHVDVRGSGRTWGDAPSWAQPIMGKRFQRGMGRGVQMAQASTGAGAGSDSAPEGDPWMKAVEEGLRAEPPARSPYFDRYLAENGGFTREQLIGEAQRRGLPPPDGRSWSDMLLDGKGSQPQEPARSSYFDDYMQKVEEGLRAGEGTQPPRVGADEAAQTVMGVFQKHGQSITPEQAANIAKAAQDKAGNAFAAGAGDGWFFGFGDNILAALRGYTSEDRTYEGELRRIRIAQDLLEAFNPNATMAGEISGGIASGLATGGLGSAAGVGAGVTTAGKIGRAALGGAGAGGLYGAGSSDGENVGEETLKGAAFGAGGGVVGREVGIALGKVLRRLVGSPQFFDGNRLTDAGRKALAARGLDPALVSDDFAQRFASRVKEAGGASDEVVNMAIAEEFGIPLTRGQATGDVMQIAYEEASRNAARGNSALNTVRSIDNEARRRTGQAVDDIASGFGGADASALGAAERVTEGVKRAASGARQAARSSYAELDAASGGFSGRLVRDLDAALSSRLKEAVPPDAVNANGALAALRRTLGKASAEGQSFTAGELERVRQMLGRYRTAAFKGANAADQMAMQEIVGAFDGWLDDVFTSGLTTADPATLALAQKSRGLWKAYLDNFTARSGDDASKLMAKMVEIDVTPAEAARWIWGTSNIGAKGVSVRLAQKLRTALPPEDWNAVRAGAWRMVAEAPPGKEFGPQAIANNIEAFTKGDGAAMARVLFSAEEIAQMQRFSRAMRLLVPPKAATQPSKTSYGVARLVSDTWDNFGAMMGFATGGLEGGLGAKLGGMAMRGARDGMAARSIPARGPASVINRAPETLGGAAAGGASASVGAPAGRTPETYRGWEVLPPANGVGR